MDFKRHESGFERIERIERIEEHKGGVMGKHILDNHHGTIDNIHQQFNILRSCKDKLECFIYEIFFIQVLRPTLNKQ